MVPQVGSCGDQTVGLVSERAEPNVAASTQKPAHALATGLPLRAARMIVVNVEQDPTTARLVRTAHGASAALCSQKGFVLLFGERVLHADRSVGVKLRVLRVAKAPLFRVSRAALADLRDGGVGVKTQPARRLTSRPVGRVSSGCSCTPFGVLLRRACAGRGSLGHVDLLSSGWPRPRSVSALAGVFSWSFYAVMTSSAPGSGEVGAGHSSELGIKETP